MSTVTSTKVCGWWHLLATVTVRLGPSPDLASTATPLLSVFKMSALSKLVPTMIVAFSSASDVMLSSASTFKLSLSVFPLKPP